MSGNLLIDITTVRMTLDRLLAQDSWEAPYVTAAHAALDRIVAHPDGTLNETREGSDIEPASHGSDVNLPVSLSVAVSLAERLETASERIGKPRLDWTVAEMRDVMREAAAVLRDRR